jgi:hypothetical protein
MTLCCVVRDIVTGSWHTFLVSIRQKRGSQDSLVNAISNDFEPQIDLRFDQLIASSPRSDKPVLFKGETQ